MKLKRSWTKIIFIIGIIALALGALDPMEGSIVIVAGGILVALSAFFANNRYRNIFLATAMMMIVGVFTMFYASSLGGFDPKREWWWLILILPYPLGWLISVITLVVMAVKKLSRSSKQTS